MVLSKEKLELYSNKEFCGRIKLSKSPDLYFAKCQNTIFHRVEQTVQIIDSNQKKEIPLSNVVELVEKTLVPFMEEKGFRRNQRATHFVEHTLGFKRIGSGVYSIVYNHPSCPNQVVKITGYDYGYRAFMDIVKELKSIHLPHIEYYKNFGDNLAITVSEKLEPYFGLTSKEMAEYKCLKVDYLKDGEKMEEFRSIFFQMVRGHYYGNKRIDPLLDKVVEAIPSDNSFLMFLKTLAQIVKSKYPAAYPDLHNNNIMRRGDKLVVIDPFTWG